MAPALPTGVVRLGSGYRTFQWVLDPEKPAGRIKSKRWKADATIKEMVQWREDTRVEARKPKPAAALPVALTGFMADTATYLDAIRAMASYKDRARDIGEWIAAFANTPTSEITSVMIRACRDRWLTVGPKRMLQKTKPDEKACWVDLAVPLSASTVNHRLRALENLYTVLRPGQTNPVRDVPEADEPDQAPRGQSFALALEILSHMPDVTTPKKGGTHERGSLSRVRFEAMLWTGLPAVQLAGLRPDLVDWVSGTVLVPRRNKGKKSRRARRRQEQRRPLLPQAVAALKRLFALGANRPFSSTSLGRSMRRAIRTANVARAAQQLPAIPETITVYDLTRHTFGTEAMRASKNLKAVQGLMGHADINQTARYAMAAVTEGTALAVQQLAARARATGRTRRPRHLTAGEVSPVATSAPGRSPKQKTRKMR